MPIERDKSYAEVNFGAHRKPAPQIGAPSLCQHFAFWKPRDVTRPKWHKSIDYQLLRIFLLMWDQFCRENEPKSATHRFFCPNLDRKSHNLYLCRHHTKISFQQAEISDSLSGDKRTLLLTNEEERSIRYELFTVRSPFHGIDLTVRAELRNEFWTLTFIGDLTRPMQIEKSGTDLANFRNSFSELGDFFLSRIKNDPESKARVGIVAEEQHKLENVGRHFYDDFNTLIADQIVAPSLMNFPNDGEINTSFIGGAFADFRGVVLGVSVRPSKNVEKQKTLDFDKEASKQSLFFDFSKPVLKHPPPNPSLNAPDILYPFSSRTGLRIVEALWPAVRMIFRSKLDSTRESSKPEFTVTAFQKRRALYISSLGRLTHDIAKSREPVRYALIVSYPGRWQIGRLVERMHNLGTLRLAAIYDISRLQNASDRLRDLYDEWQTSKRRRDQVNGQDLDARVFVTKLEALGSDMQSGLTFRIERSAYYVKTFNDILGEMRLNRLEGFQPYDDFVRRRMGGAFEFIQRIGFRYNELRREIELTLEQQRTEQMVQLQKSALSIAGHVQTIEKEISDTTKGMTSLQSRTNALLERAEWFLALGTIYYFAAFLFEMVSDFLKFTNIDYRGLPKSWFYLATLIIAVAFVLLIRMKKKNE